MRHIVEMYFNAWLNKDNASLPQIFAENIIYSECYGPEYFGLNQVVDWFNDWNTHATVLKWDIKQTIEQNDTCVVEWYFECVYKNKRNGFDGVSIIKFDNENKIFNLKEFQSKAEHHAPYGKIEL